MAINYTVQARVVDLRSFAPGSADVFVVDTNVWFWATYPIPSIDSHAPAPYQATEYPDFLKRAQTGNSTIFWLGFSWIELARLVESTQFRADERAHKIPVNTTLKEYRHNYKARHNQVAADLHEVWTDVEALGTPAPGFTIDQESVYQAEADFPQSCLDGFDLFFVQATQKANATGLVSDDGDFCTMPGITLFTANQSVIKHARMQGKLVTR